MDARRADEPNGSGGPWTVGLLPDEPAGLVITRTPGSALLRATLCWPHLREAPEEPHPPEPLAAASRSILETGDGIGFCFEHETTAETRRALGAALDAALRTTAAYAALTDAMLEAAVVRRHEPRIASRRALEELACCLLRAGLRVRFATSRRPAPAADVWVGTGGAADEIEDLLRSHPLWVTP